MSHIFHLCTHEETLDEDRKRISDAIKTEKDCSVNLLNYKKDGSTFVNEVSFVAYIDSFPITK